MKTKSFFLILFMMVCILALPGTIMADEKKRLIVAEFNSEKMQKGAPSGWELIDGDGTANLALEKKENRYVLHMKSDSESSFGIKKEMDVKINEYPFLNWEWKVDKLPTGADIRNKDTDDQAIQVYIAFKPTGWPAKMNTPTIGYIWGVNCPKNTLVTSPQPFAGKVRYIVLRDKSDNLNKWYQEKRNIKEDYKKLFHDIDSGKLRDIEGISFYINSQHTKSQAESYIYNVRFSKD